MTRFAASGAVALMATAAIAAQSAGADTTTGQPPTIATQYTPNQIGVSQTTGVTYTITDPNSSGSLAQISFVDTLPQLSTVDDPSSASNSGCGTGIAVTANPGASTVSVSGITVKAGTPCTVSVALIGNTAGTASDSYSNALYATGAAGSATPGPVPASSETPAALQVIGAPTISVTVPKNNAVYSFGQVVKASYRCTAASGDQQSELTCSAVDDLGNSINSGQALDTSVPGQHQLLVEAISGVTGDTTNATVDYTVRPDNEFTVSHVKPQPSGAVSFQLGLPGAGKIVVKELAGGKTVHSKNLTVGRKRTLGVTLAAPSAAATVELKVTYTPKGGTARTVTVRGIHVS